MPGPRVLAVRHAPTLGQGICIGDAEVACAMPHEETAERILERLPSRAFRQVWSSSLSRCSIPARHIADRLHLPLLADERLREISLGRWQGRSFADIEASDGDHYRRWLSQWERLAPPQGEAAIDVSRRVASWWKQLPAGNHLLIAHAGVLRALRVLVGGATWKQAMTSPVRHLEPTWFQGLESDTRER